MARSPAWPWGKSRKPLRILAPKLVSTFHLDLLGPNNPIWIDGTDELVEGSRGFASSATPFPFALKTLPWEPGEPNGGKGENCLALWWYGGSKNAYMVADWSCGSKSRAICEREAPGAAP